MKEQLELIRQSALTALAEAKDLTELDNLRVKFLGKKGELTAVLKLMGKLSAEERPIMGQMANNVRAELESAMEEKEQETPENPKVHDTCRRLQQTSVHEAITPKAQPTALSLLGQSLRLTGLP